MKSRKVLPKILFLLVFAAFQTPLFAAETIGVPQGGAIVIDGKIEEKEWQDAAAFELKGGGRVFFKHDGGAYLFIGVRGAKSGWSQIYLSEGENTDVRVYHASAALGAVVYSLDKNLLWQPAGEFAWELRDRVVNAETEKKMADYLAQNGWVANNRNMSDRNETEYRIKLRDVSQKQFRVAVEYAADKELQFFPATLDDDTLKSQLAFGYTPKDLKFDHKGWAKISLKNKQNQNPPVSVDKITDEKAAAAEVADKLFDALRAKNADGVRALFTAEGQFVAVDKPRNGKGISTRRVFTAEAFAKMVGEAKAEYIEKMPDKEVQIFGDFALVTGRYTFYVGEKFSHCGVNSFHLVRTADAGWKIANAASTLEFDCGVQQQQTK